MNNEREKNNTIETKAAKNTSRNYTIIFDYFWIFLLIISFVEFCVSLLCFEVDPLDRSLFAY